MYSIIYNNILKQIHAISLPEIVKNNYQFSTSEMPKKNVKNVKSSGETKMVTDSANREAIELDKDRNILINVHAKPGSKQNTIQGEIIFPDQPRIDIKIAARAVEGQANTELIEYLADLLNIRKSDFTITRGMKCREKTVCISRSTISLQQVKEKLQNEISKSKH